MHEFCIERSFLKSQNCWLSVKKDLKETMKEYLLHHHNQLRDGSERNLPSCLGNDVTLCGVNPIQKPLEVRVTHERTN